MKTLLKSLLMLAVGVVSLVGFSGCETYDYDQKVTTYRVGDRVDTLPRRYRTVDIDGRTYYYANGNYYTTRSGAYYVVNRPVRPVRATVAIGTTYDRLPPRYQTVRYGNQSYYYYNGVYYRPRGSAYVTVRDPFDRW